MVEEKKLIEIMNKVLESGKLRIGINEVTKSIERGEAKVVFFAKDVSPKEIVAHIPALCNEMKIPYIEVEQREKLGSYVKIKSTTAVSVVELGSAKDDIEKITKKEKEETKE